MLKSKSRWEVKDGRVTRIPDIFQVPSPPVPETTKAAVIPPPGKKDEPVPAMTKEQNRVTAPVNTPAYRPPAVDRETRAVKVGELDDVAAGPLVLQLQRTTYYLRRLGTSVYWMSGVLIGLTFAAWAWLLLYLTSR